MENESELEKLKIKLESEVRGLASRHPNMVNPLERELGRPVPEEREITVDGKTIDTYSVYQPVRNLFYAEAVPEDRVANLLSLCLKFIKAPVYKHSLKGNLEKLRGRKSLRKDRATSERIESWIKRNQNETEPFSIPSDLFIAMPFLFNHVDGAEYSSFLSQLGKIVFNNIEAGLSAGEVISVLEKQEFTAALIGTTTLKSRF